MAMSNAVEAELLIHMLRKPVANMTARTTVLAPVLNLDRIRKAKYSSKSYFSTATASMNPPSRSMTVVLKNGVRAELNAWIPITDCIKGIRMAVAASGTASEVQRPDATISTTRAERWFGSRKPDVCVYAMIDRNVTAANTITRFLFIDSITAA